MQWNAPNYRLADAYINNTIDERNRGRAGYTYVPPFEFNSNNLRGSDNDFRTQMQEIMAQSDYNLEREIPNETLTDKLGTRGGEYVQDRLDEHKHNSLIDQEEQPKPDIPQPNTTPPQIQVHPIIQPQIIRCRPSIFDSIITTTVLVIIGIILCFFLLRAMFPDKKQNEEPQKPVGNMNLESTESTPEIESENTEQ